MTCLLMMKNKKAETRKVLFEKFSLLTSCRELQGKILDMPNGLSLKMTDVYLSSSGTYFLNIYFTNHPKDRTHQGMNLNAMYEWSREPRVTIRQIK